MQLRTFLAPDMKLALARVRTELGPNAVIIASQRAKGGGVMVRAAAEALEAPAGEAPPPRKEAPAGDFPEVRVDDTLIARLRGNAPSPRPAAAIKRFERAGLLAILRANRAPEQLSHRLAQAAEKSRLPDMTLALAAALDTEMRLKPFDMKKPGAVLLVGPNGAGKTAIAAKLAAHAILVQRPAHLVATDAAGAGAVARLETFAGHLNAPFHVAGTPEELRAVIEAGAKESALVVADTFGFDPRDNAACRNMAPFAELDGIEVMGVLSATGDAEEVGEIAYRLAGLGVERVAVTGLDLVRRYGALAAAASAGPALAHVTRSPFVAAGLETLSPLALARTLICAPGGQTPGDPQ